MKQIKKRFLLLLSLMLIISQKTEAKEIVSDVVNQKSVIEEQQISLNAGVAIYLDDIEINIQEYVRLAKAKKVVEETLPAPPPKKENIYKQIELSDYEKELIYKITFAESGNQSIKGQRAVIEVIFNRVLSDDFPNTVEGVLSAPKQFSTWGKINDTIYNEKQIEALSLVLEEEPILPNKNYVYFSRGKSNGKNHIDIGEHWFGEK